ncbi:protein-serine O-palmitoleoyltransferase porcupine [Chelonus insularis]|uniref:protein-serine O-palmitoleoyltransferase porcupine n=1 Tax=Chelonus insularis TaxID=460826 RepID=UPI00158EBC4E|nr:protein-serine O-palmitoleoyltransferase porcupine [Chelonus insularis]
MDISYYDDNECSECNDYDRVQQIPETFQHNYENCLIPSVYGTLEYLFPLFLFNIIFKLLITQAGKISSNELLHSISIIFGIFIIYYFVPESLYLLLIYVIISYGCLCLPLRPLQNYRIEMFIISLVIILYCEYTMDPVAWHKIRSVIMIAAMKAISMSFDKATSTPQPFLLLSNFLQYAGYIFNPSTCLFGPWISFQDYITLLTHVESEKSIWVTLPLNIFRTLKSLSISLTFLIMSNCWTQWFISEEAQQFTGGKWLLAYRDALSFRTSHYFISYLSATLLIIGGSTPSSLSSLTTITRPIDIEMPRSLVQVVISWNVPMHTWLKLYIFRPAVRSIGKFNAVALTYLTSSLLHGLNFQLAAVLLSLGLYTYVEFQLRHILAKTFDACISAKECPSSSGNINSKICRYEKHWYNNGWVFLVNFAFSALSVFHLAYLGLMFDTSDLQETGYNYSHTIEKWSHLGFASHWVAFTMYLIYFFIK